MTLKIVVVAPMPSASVTIASAAKLGLLRRPRNRGSRRDDSDPRCEQQPSGRPLGVSDTGVPRLPDAYTVSRQTHEIGIRMALGAGRGDVLRMVATMGLRLVALGVAIGLVATLGVTRIVASQIWGVSPHDPLTLTIVVSMMALVAIAACYFPARRATRVDPMIALGCE